MGTSAVNPLESGDIKLIEYWVSCKMDLEDPSEIDQTLEGWVLGYDELGYAECFDEWTMLFSNLLNARLIDVEDLQDFLILLEFIRPDDEHLNFSFEQIKEKIEIKIEGIEKREG